MHPLKASVFCTCGFAGEAGPEIMGSWEVSDNDWKLSARRAGEDTIATISRGANEIGPLSGRFNGSFFELSFFDGNRAALLEIEPRKDGALDLSWMEPGIAVKKMKAVRAEKNRNRASSPASAGSCITGTVRQFCKQVLRSDSN